VGRRGKGRVGGGEGGKREICQAKINWNLNEQCFLRKWAEASPAFIPQRLLELLSYEAASRRKLTRSLRGD